MKSRFLCLIWIGCCFAYTVNAQHDRTLTDRYIWKGASLNSSESMPLGGAGMGLNVWVENGFVYLYFAHNGWFDEQNALLKGGRIRIKLTPNYISNQTLTQELDLKNGLILINGNVPHHQQTIRIWCSVKNPSTLIHIKSDDSTTIEAAYESWRTKDRVLTPAENNGNSYKWDKKTTVISFKDSIQAKNNTITFYHQNRSKTIFDAIVTQQKLESIKNSLWNPIGNRIMGGRLFGNHFTFTGIDSGLYHGIAYRSWHLKSRLQREHQLCLQVRCVGVESKSQWEKGIDQQQKEFQQHISLHQIETKKWWHDRYQRSFIQLLKSDDSAMVQMVRNYQLFRFMVNCTASGAFPIKFNGGLFTFDPIFTDAALHTTPDFRKWGGGIFTAQNQRLIYWPLLRSGDIDQLKAALELYRNMLPTAEARTQQYWGHKGASFTEQIEVFGLPNYAEYGLKRPEGLDPGMEHNAWLEYEWDTALEFCLMALEAHRYSKITIQPYIPFVLSTLRFFDEHYQYLAHKNEHNKLDSNGHLIIFPGSAGETFKLARNPSSTIAGLRSVCQAALKSNLLMQHDAQYVQGLLNRLPSIPLHTMFGKTTIAPAEFWARVNNVESMMLYPVFPWGIYGLGKPRLDIAINTYLTDSFALKFRSHIGWKQDNIFAARLGLTDEAVRLNKAKLANGPFRFPAFWGPGYDWTPDHNWGGSGMIGLQEMLMQTPDQKILLFPAWPANQDVHFKLHAPDKTTVEVKLVNGKIIYLQVTPLERKKDVIICLR